MEPNEIFRMLHKITCEVMQVDYYYSFSKTQSRDITEARQVTMYILAKRLAVDIRFTYKTIGEFFITSELRDGYNYGTVRYAEKIIQTMIDINSVTHKNVKFAHVISQIIHRFKSMTAQLDNLPFDLMTPKKAVLWALLGL